MKNEHTRQKKKQMKGIRLLTIATIIVVIVVGVYIGILEGYSLPQGQVFRLWFSRTLPLTLLFITQGLIVLWLCVLSWCIKRRFKKSLGKRIGLWCIGIVLLFIIALGILFLMLNEKSEHYKEDGTVIIKSPIWLDQPKFYLYQEENFLTLRYLRDADGLDDNDATISAEEYDRKKQEEFKKEKQQARKDNKIYYDPQEDERNRKIEEGYQKIYDTYLKDENSEYKKNYNAKGYSYIVVYEDETQIRYVMYDRDDEQEKKAQYVYFRNEKKSDGSWSPTESEILDMFEYDYESKEVKDLQKVE